MILKNKKKARKINWVGEHRFLLQAIFILILTYCLFLTASISLFDAATPVDTRILSPLSIYFYLLVICLFHILYQQNNSKNEVLFALMGLCMAFSWTATRALPARYKYPNGYNKPYWQQEAKAIVCDSQEIWIRKNRTIYTNAFPYWRLMDDRLTIKIPELENAVKQLENKNIHEDLLAMREAIARDSAQLVFFFDLPHHSNKVPKPVLFSYFSDSNRFLFIPIPKGLIIQSKKLNSN
ncbi:MAG: hypothetical protein FGM54_08490 [Chitinophagaceae bacterium]|nr:hypothetical protein [Chitinophagaceae bacterium]